MFLSLLRLLRQQHVSYECIVIDQSNGNEEYEKLKALDIPNLRVVHQANHGFGKGANHGAGIARGEYLCFLNPDLEVKKFNWSRLKTFLSVKNRDIFLGARLFLPNGSIQVSAWWFPSIISESLRRLANRLSEKGIIWWKKILVSFTRKPRYVPWITGALYFIPEKTFKTLRGFDEKFFLFFEDVDLCYRARKMGAAGYWIPYIEAVHLESSLSKQDGNKALQWFRDSREYFWKKHYSRFSGRLLRVAQKISDFRLFR